jgi:RNA polymerase sigma-70 factor, ECF subfamily
MAGDPAGSTKGRTMDHSGSLEQIVGTAYTTHSASVLRYLTSITRDAASAEDLTQDAFVRLTIEVSAGRTPDDVGAWLHRVGHNLAMSRGRRLSVADRHIGELARPHPAPSPEAAAISGEEHRAALDAMSVLPLTHRRALIMASYGVDGPEIARSIGRSQGATRTLLCRARASIRTSLLAAEMA